MAQGSKLVVVGGADVERAPQGEWVTKVPIAEYLHELARCFDKCTWMTSLYEGPSLTTGRLNPNLVHVVPFGKGLPSWPINWFRTVAQCRQGPYVLFFLPATVPLLPAMPVVRQLVRRMAVYLDNHEAEEILSIDQLDQQERAVSLAASLAKHYIERGYLVSLVTRDGGVEDGDGQAQLTRILRVLAQVSFCQEQRPYALAPPPGGACIFVSRGGCSLGRPPARAA